MADIERARRLRQKETWAEKLVWRWLRDRRFSRYKFRRQHPVGNYCLDFFCEAALLSFGITVSPAIQLNGKARVAERQRFLNSLGIKTLRFWNSYLRRNAQSVRDTIFNELERRAPHPLPDYTRPMSVAKSQLEKRPPPP